MYMKYMHVCMCIYICVCVCIYTHTYTSQPVSKYERKKKDHFLVGWEQGLAINVPQAGLQLTVWPRLTLKAQSSYFSFLSAEFTRVHDHTQCRRILMLKKKNTDHTCNPTYSGGRNQEDRSSKPAWANISRDPVLKMSNTYTHTHTHTHTKTRAGGVAQAIECLPSKYEALSSKPSTTREKKRY
jgi:hypothetical protein